jgi:hypothetical protein
VISEVGRVTPGDTNTYTLDQATQIKLQQYSANGTNSVTAAGSMLLPQTTAGQNSAISGEFGSASEGVLQQSGNGQYLTIMGYGINAATFNSNPGKYTGARPPLPHLDKAPLSRAPRPVSPGSSPLLVPMEASTPRLH